MENIIKYVILVLFIAAVGALLFMAGYSRSRTLALYDRTGQAARTGQSAPQVPSDVREGSNPAAPAAQAPVLSPGDKQADGAAKKKALQYAKEHPEAAEKQIAEMKKYLTLPYGLSPEAAREHMLLLAAAGEEEKKPGARKKEAETITMGVYPQREGVPEDPIEWRIIDRLDGNTVFVVSKYVLEYKPYDDNREKTSLAYFWYRSTLKEWLDGNFYNSAFSEEEKTRILTSNIIQQSGANVKGRVFVLHTEEAKRFFRDDRDRVCLPTERAKAQKPRDPGIGDSGLWWARSSDATPVGSGLGAVTGNGAVIDSMGYAGLYYLGVRPAMWVRLR
ncbi:MAG: hypothetical protein J5758_00180 [Abditibacteriota bacterium]|nr:hypothetical protein [Abditibacteriota bacterium]